MNQNVFLFYICRKSRGRKSLAAKFEQSTPETENETPQKPPPAKKGRKKAPLKKKTPVSKVKLPAVQKAVNRVTRSRQKQKQEEEAQAGFSIPNFVAVVRETGYQAPNKNSLAYQLSLIHI